LAILPNRLVYWYGHNATNTAIKLGYQLLTKVVYHQYHVTDGTFLLSVSVQDTIPLLGHLIGILDSIWIQGECCDEI
jgi:hypothetical protein